MAAAQERKELDTKAREGEPLVPGGAGGKSLEAQEHFAEGRSQGGQIRREQFGTEGYQEMCREGGLSTMDQSGSELVDQERIDIKAAKFINSA